MGVIELAGRLKNVVRLNGIYYRCKDINLDKDFLLEIVKELFIKLNCDASKTEYNKIFEEEIISEVKFNIKIGQNNFHFILTRDTYGDKIIIGCLLEPDKEEQELFGNVYESKIKIIEFFNKICENSNVYILQDFNNEIICRDAYMQIHRIENRLRNLITKYLIKKYGHLVFSNSLKNEIDEYSKWFRNETKNKYQTFKRVNTDYANLDFSKIIKILDLSDTKCVDETGTSVSEKLINLNDLLCEDINYSDINKRIAEIREKISKRKSVFDDSLSKKDNEEFKKEFGFVNEPDGIQIILDNDFKSLWENELTKMRNMVAHNKPICKELYNDITLKCNFINKKFDECFSFINRHFYSDEEGVLSALEDYAIEEDERIAFEAEQAREQAGIQFSLSKNVIETEIEGSWEIKNFIDSISVLENMREYFDTIDCFNKELALIDEEDIPLYLKEDIFNLINVGLGLDKTFCDVIQLNFKSLIKNLLYGDINIEKAIEIYTDDDYYSFNSEKFEYFCMDYNIKWFSFDNKLYNLTFNGEIKPENGEEDTIYFELFINGEPIKKYSIRVDYGDYSIPSEGSIDYSEVEYLISDIIDIVKTTHKNFLQIYGIVKLLLEKLELLSK